MNLQHLTNKQLMMKLRADLGDFARAAQREAIIEGEIDSAALSEAFRYVRDAIVEIERRFSIPPITPYV